MVPFLNCSGWPLITNHANKESIRQGKNPTTENSSDTSGGGQFLVQSHTRQHGSQCAWILICLTLQHTQLSDEIISFCQRMEIELSDFKDGKPLVFKGSGEQVQQIAQLKGAKKYKEMLDVSLGLPATKDSLMLRASALLHLREWNKLIECCNSGIALDENESEFYNLKGKAVGKLGNQEQKVTLLKIALQLNDSVAAYHRNLGAALYTLKEYPQAIREHSRAIQIEPNNSINYHNKGAALFRSGKYAQAKAEFTKAVERDPSLALSYSWIGDSEKQLGRPHEAVAMYTKAYEVSGNVLYLKQKQKLQKEISPKKEQQEEKKKKKMFGLF